jgi:hypothetical protein
LSIARRSKQRRPHRAEEAETQKAFIHAGKSMTPTEVPAISDIS